MSPSADYRFMPFASHSYRFSPTISVPARGSYSSLGEIGFPLPRSAFAAFVLSIDEALAIWWSLLSECLCDMVVALNPSIRKRSTVSLDALPSLPKAAAKVLLYLASKMFCKKNAKKNVFSL